MKLTDLLSEEEWIKLEEDIHQRFGMDTNVFNTKGIRITTFKSWVNELCPEIKATDKGQSFICAVAHMNLATMAQNAFSRQSEYLAYLVQQEMEKELRGLKLKNRGVKQGPFWVMVGATMPNILVETGFLSNSYDLKILKTNAYQYKIAQGIFEGFKRYKRDYESTI